jgi:dCMP deaminase
VIYPIYYKEQTDNLSRRNFFQILSMETPTLLRYKNYCVKHIEHKLSLEQFVSLDDRLTYEIMTPEKSFIVKNYMVNDSSKEELFAKVAKHSFLSKIGADNPRPHWDNYFMRIAYVSRARSNCMKRSVGAVLVKHKRIVSIGYNGTPVGMTNCNEGGCERCNSNKGQGEDLDKCLCIHGEESAILECGVKEAAGCTLYCTMYPCLWCAKIIIQARVTRIVFGEDYNMPLSKKILAEAKIIVDKCDIQDKQF